MLIYMIQQRDWRNGKFTKWEWWPKFAGLCKASVESEFRDYFNDGRMSYSAQHFYDTGLYRIKSFRVSLPKIIQRK